MDNVVYQFTHADMQELVNHIGNLPWVMASPAMEVIKRVKELKLVENTGSQLELPNVEGK